jgi:putative ABC transport system permease protein
MARTNQHNQRLWLLLRWLIHFIGVIVPRRFRTRWRQEWEAELEYREASLARWDRLDWRNKLELLWRSLGAFWDALWLQPQRLEDEMFQDLRYGARLLLKQKSFTVVAVLSLALGIGANTAIFQLLDAVRLRTLPVKAPQELAEVRLTTMDGTRGNKSARYPAVTNPIWEQLRERQQGFSSICAWSPDSFNLAQGGEVRNARALWVSGDFFKVLGVPPLLGRVFTAADDQRGCGAPGVVISHAFWQREYGSAADIIGRKITLGNRPLEIIGVTPPEFFGLEVGQSFDLAVPICAEAFSRGNRLDSGTNWWLMVTGRLKPGWSLGQATAQLQTISPSLFEKTLPANYPPVSVKDYLGSKLEAVSASAGYSVLRSNYESSLWLLLAIAGLVLLIACANLANLLLARASVRERELAVRQALGASRARLVRQLLVESLLLAVIGAALGALLAQSLSQFLVAFLSTSGDKVFLELGVDWRVLGFAAALAVLTCVLFGLMPAVRAARIEPGTVMKAGGRGLTTSHGRFSLRRALVVVQVALSLVLVAGALLFTRSLYKLLTVEAGFEREGLLITRVNFGRLSLPPERRLAFRRELLDRFKALPGVEAATEADTVPLTGGGRSNTVWLDGTATLQKVNTNINRVGLEYFKTLRMPLLAGRDFDDRDAANTPQVAIINETLARQLLPGAHPAQVVGRRFWIEATPNDPETLYEIVGLVKDTKFEELRETIYPLLFLAAAQDPRPGAGRQFLLRSSLPQSELTAAVTRVLNEINPVITVSFQGFKTMVEDSLLRERLLATLSGFFGALALLLASIGLYGLLAYNVASRTNEIGIRMALGAQARNVRWLILREALLLLLAGVVVGLPLIVAVTRWAATLLYGLTPTDPISLGLAALSLLAVTVLAGYVPARRATKLNPLTALRHD